MRNKKLVIAVGSLAAAALVLSGCAGKAENSTGNGNTNASVWATATSAAAAGGMEALIEAAKKEGELNVIALPDTWANYGLIKKAFTAKYGIKLNDQLPDASSKTEIDTAEKTRGTNVAPDVFDLGTQVALASTNYFAPYKVTNWDKIPDANKEASGLWVNDYAGVMAVGYNKTKFGEVTSLADLTDSKFAGQVALNGIPAESGAAFSGLLMLSNAHGGDFNNLQPGLDYVKKLKEAGSLNLQDVSDGTISSGTHGVVFDWAYNQVSYKAALQSNGVEWEIFVPQGGEISSFYNQAINKDAPHPAAARLWQEFLYSPEAQNLWLKGGALPVLFDAMKKDGSLDAEWENYLPKLDAVAKTPSLKEAEELKEFIKAHWDATIS